MKSNLKNSTPVLLKRKSAAALASPSPANKPKTAVVPVSAAFVPPTDSDSDSSPSDVDVKKPLKVVQLGAKAAPVPAGSGSGSDTDSDSNSSDADDKQPAASLPVKRAPVPAGSGSGSDTDSDSNSSDADDKQPASPLPFKRARVPGQMLIEVFNCTWRYIGILRSVMRRENSPPAMYQVSANCGMVRVSDIPVPLHYRQYFDSEDLRSKNVKKGELLEIAHGELQFVRENQHLSPVRIRADCSDCKAELVVQATFSKFAYIMAPGLAGASGLSEEGRLGHTYRLLAVLVRAPSPKFEDDPLSDPQVCSGLLLERRDKDGRRLPGTDRNNVMLFYKPPKSVMTVVADEVKLRLGLASAPTPATALAWFDVFDELLR